MKRILTSQACEAFGINLCQGVFLDTFLPKMPLVGLPYTSTISGTSIYYWCRSFTGKERDEETGYGYFGARYMDHELMTMWLSVDPLADKYPGISPYAYCVWNPVKLVDPDGNHIEVVSNNDGTYTVKNGQVNKDQNIYIIDKNGERTGEILGTMLTKYSFFGEDKKVVEGAIIDPSDNSGKEFLNGVLESDMTLGEYVFNKETGGHSNGNMDFKTVDMPSGLNKDDRTRYQYRGMRVDGIAGIGEGVVYGSARDIGNYAAGYMAGSRGLSWLVTRVGFDAYQSMGTKTVQRESIVSREPQKMGYWYGFRTSGYKLMLNIK